MNLSHAGGVIYRRSAGAVKFLLVGPSKDKPSEWVLPKGHIETGETPEQTAVREAGEETGVTARIICPLETLVFEAKNSTVRARFYLMQLISETEPQENGVARGFHLGTRLCMPRIQGPRRYWRRQRLV